MKWLDIIKKWLGMDKVSKLPNYEWNASRLCIAGVDRDWHKLNASDVCESAVKDKCNAIGIEMVGNDVTDMGLLERKYKEYTSEARKRNLIVFVCILNDWVNDNYFKNYASRLRTIVINEGPKGIIAQPVGETHTSRGSSFEKETVKMLKEKGFKTCCNNNGGRPNSTSGMDYAAWHSSGANANSNCPRGFIEITDHGDKIRWIGYFDANKVAALAQNVKNRGCGFGLYRYVGMGNNGSPSSLPISASRESWKRMGQIYK